MNLFNFGFWGTQTKGDLKEALIRKENEITTLRDEKISAQILESRAQSGFNAQQESDRVTAEVREARLNREITKLKAELADFDRNLADEVAEETKAIRRDAEAEVEAAIKKAKAELRAEFTQEVKSLKTENTNLVKENGKFKGLYDGAVNVIATQKTQNETLAKMNTSLVGALPTIKVDTRPADNNVTVNN